MSSSSSSLSSSLLSSSLLSSSLSSSSSRQRHRRCCCGFGLVVLVLSLVLFQAVTTTASAWKQRRQPHHQQQRDPVVKVFSRNVNEEDAPFPGFSWLDRVASTSRRRVTVNGVEYSSGYEAMVQSPKFRKNRRLQSFRNFNAWINSFLFSADWAALFVESGGSVEWAHYGLCYLRDLVAAMIVYYGTSMIFHYHCYIHPRHEKIFANRVRPTAAIMWDQIQLAQASMFLYVGLPVLSEWLIEEGYTQAYYQVSEIGGVVPCIGFLVLYFALVEIGIYWMHRTLHTNKFLYKHVHMLHHKYNRPDTLTPWASIAFHPLDGMLQASPYVVCLPVVPVHYLSHILLLFLTAVWSTYIHDAMDWNVDPIMGSKYHTVHHTHYIYNYGQVFTFCDAFWGTLMVPQTKTGVVANHKKTKNGNTQSLPLGRLGNKGGTKMPLSFVEEEKKS